MKVLLDECVDARLAPYVVGFETRTVHDQCWVGIKNGKLLTLAASEFDVLVTVDRNLPFQQHLPKFQIAIILLLSPSNRLADLMRLIPELTIAIPVAKAGEIMRVGR